MYLSMFSVYKVQGIPARWTKVGEYLMEVVVSRDDAGQFSSVSGERGIAGA